MTRPARETISLLMDEDQLVEQDETFIFGPAQFIERNLCIFWIGGKSTGFLLSSYLSTTSTLATYQGNNQSSLPMNLWMKMSQAQIFWGNSKKNWTFSVCLLFWCFTDTTDISQMYQKQLSSVFLANYYSLQLITIRLQQIIEVIAYCTVQRTML